MKLQKMILTLAPALILAQLASQPVFAEGTGVRGGGVAVDINGRPTLKDLVDNTDCVWIKASDLAIQLPHFAVIQKNIENENWYLSYNLERELPNLPVCRTQAHLVTISTKDQDGLTIDTTPGGTTQVGIRVNQEIYLDMSVFSKMTESDQAYLLLHEVMHSFISINTPQRNSRLRSFVAAIQSLEMNPMSAETFALQMRDDDIDVPFLNPMQEKLARIILDPNATTLTIQKIAAANQLCSVTILSKAPGIDYQESNLDLSCSLKADLYFGAFYSDEPHAEGIVREGYYELNEAVVKGDTSSAEQLIQDGGVNPGLQIHPLIQQPNTVQLPTNVSAVNYCATFFGSATSTDCNIWPRKDNGKLKNQKDFKFEISVNADYIDNLQYAILLSNFELAQFIVDQGKYDNRSSISISLDHMGSYPMVGVDAAQLAELMGRHDLAQQIRALWSKQNN